MIHLNTERISGLLSINSLISVQLDHAEYVFLLRAMENLKETTVFFDHQEKKFSVGDSSKSMVIGAVIPQVDVFILFPPQAASALHVCYLPFDFLKGNSLMLWNSSRAWMMLMIHQWQTRSRSILIHPAWLTWLILVVPCKDWNFAIRIPSTSSRSRLQRLT